MSRARSLQLLQFCRQQVGNHFCVSLRLERHP